MKTLILSVIFMMSNIGTTVDMHEFHLSKSTINYDTESQSIQITMHLFIDDLEDALAARDIPKLYIGTEKEDSTADTYISQYIADQFTLHVGKNSLEQSYLGKELSDDLAAIWCYIEVSDIDMNDNLQFQNDILMEIFDDQKNVMEFRIDKKRHKDFLLKKSDSKASVDLR